MTNQIHPTDTSTTRFPTRFGIRRFLPSHAPFALALALVLLGLCGCDMSRKGNVDAWHPPSGYVPVDQFDLIRNAADQEALYTLAGGLKPMSSGIWQGSFELDAPDLTELRDVRRALAPLCNDVWYADVQIFKNTNDGERQVQAFVVHRESLARMIERHKTFWNPQGITPCTHPAEIVAIVDRMPRADRWRGYGYLFGYPDHAVDFFVEAGLALDDGREVGPGKDREFIQIPTQVADSGRFTYAVPPGHVPIQADQALAENAGLILTAYEQRRHRLVDVDDTVKALLQLNRQFEYLPLTESSPGRQKTAGSPQ